MSYAKSSAMSLLVTLLAMALAPILPVFARPQMGQCDNASDSRIEPRLPVWLWWFQTPDNSLYGNVGWRTIHCPDWLSYWGQVKWLWRNPAYGFDWFGPAAALVMPDATLQYSGDPYVTNSTPGVFHVTITNPDGSRYWNYFRVLQVGSRLLKLNFGWKLKTYAEVPDRLRTDRYAAVVTTIKLSRIN
jgi:hypothetical protein